MNRRKGQGLVEFALILPVLLLIILGIIEAAFVIQGYITVQHAAREAARFAVAYQPVQGECLDGVLAPYPFCPRDYAVWAAEPDDAYYVRRVAIIKREARRAATGLRINDAHLGDTPEKFEQYKNDPGFFGVLVWGYPSFLTDCNDPIKRDTECFDHPGLEGLPVQVLVRHNIAIVDPLFRAIVQYVPVQANTQMINEGVQVGFGNVPPPDFHTDPSFGETPVPTLPPSSPGGPTVVPPHTYFIELDVERATNTMPDDRAHRFVATVTDELSQTVQGARVSFSTDEGGFGYSGVEPKYVEELTGAQGRASVTLFGREPGTATMRAWIDFDGDNTWEVGEPSDEATKTWIVSGPHILVSDHEVYPEVSSIYIDVMDHDPMRNPYSLLWCVVSGTVTSAVVRDRLNVDGSGDETDILFQIPENAEGLYRLETHPAGGSCGTSDLVAYSADISVVVLPPDLSIASFEVPDLICPETVFTMSVVIANSSPGSTDQVFDVDFYVDPESSPPQSSIGVMKQWVSGIGSYGTAVVNTAMWVTSTTNVHQIWARVDTSDFVEELEEDNNAGVITITTGSTAGEWGNTGWRSPAANAADAGGDNDGFEMDPTGAYADGGGYAHDQDGVNDRHRYYNYNFNIPPGMIIQGIQVYLDGWVNRSDVGGRGWYELELSWDGGNSWTAARSTPYLPFSSSGIYVVGGEQDPWRREWTVSELSNANFRVRITSRASGTDVELRDFFLDWISVRVNYSTPGECPVRHELPPWYEEPIKPAGLVECEQLLRVGGFEGNPDTVYRYWNAGEPLAYKHQSQEIYEGSMSMRLHASMGAYPVCPAYRPYLWQTVRIPEVMTNAVTMTTMVVRGYRLVAGSGAPCSIANSPEADDRLYVQMQDSSGNDLGAGTEIVNGSAPTRKWVPFQVDVTGAVDLDSRRGQEVRVRFFAEHDADYRDTWFYLDALECEVCTGWPIPDPESGTASIGGKVRVLVNGIPQTLQGVDVWAYSPGGQVLHTITIQDGTYHFYNILPGTYTIYSEIWIGGGLLFTTKTLTVGADERSYGMDLFLL